jgi:hypothetical protein
MNTPDTGASPPPNLRVGTAVALRLLHAFLAGAAWGRSHPAGQPGPTEAIKAVLDALDGDTREG